MSPLNAKRSSEIMVVQKEGGDVELVARPSELAGAEWQAVMVATLDGSSVGRSRPGGRHFDELRRVLDSDAGNELWSHERLLAELRNGGQPDPAFSWSMVSGFLGSENSYVDVDIPATESSKCAAILDAMLTLAAVTEARRSGSAAVLTEIDELHMTSAADNTSNVRIVLKADEFRYSRYMAIAYDSGGHAVVRITGIDLIRADRELFDREGIDVPPCSDVDTDQSGSRVFESSWAICDAPADRELNSSDIVLIGEHSYLTDHLSCGVEVEKFANFDEFVQADIKGWTPYDADIIFDMTETSKSADSAEDVALAIEQVLSMSSDCANKRPGRSRMWCVTRGVWDGNSVDELVGAGLSGALNVLADENSDRWGGAIDLSELTSSCSVSQLARCVSSESRIKLYHLRDGELLVPKFTLLSPKQGQSLKFKKYASYVVAGGTGDIGTGVVEWLLDRGAGHVLVVGSRSRSDGRSACGRVTTIGADARNSATYRDRISDALVGIPRVAGVFHLAGESSSILDADVSHEEVVASIDVKVNAALVLSDMFPVGDLDHFVMFSSCGYLVGMAGQRFYGASNCVIDHIAQARHRAGDVGARTIRWTSWRDTAIVRELSDMEAELDSRGVGMISFDSAIETLDWVLGTDCVDPVVFGPKSDDATVGEPGNDDHGAAAESDVLSVLTRAISEVTEIPVSQISASGAIEDLGIDSVMVIRIRRVLEEALSVRLPVSVLWDHGSIGAVAAYIDGKRAHSS